MKRRVFFLSDHTGLTVEAMGRALLSQFEQLDYQARRWPFLDSPDKVSAAAERIKQLSAGDEARPLVFSSFVDYHSRQRLAASGALVLDFFASYTDVLEHELHTGVSAATGMLRGIGKREHYDARIRAVNFALANDDGGAGRDYAAADCVLLGVSRSGKTPTCLYLAMQFGILAANYPITDDDLQRSWNQLPVLDVRDKLFGLTINPTRLQRIRTERRPGSSYASLAQCRHEVAETEALFQRFRIPFVDITAMSVEEIAASILQRGGLESRVGC